MKLKSLVFTFCISLTLLSAQRANAMLYVDAAMADLRASWQEVTENGTAGIVACVLLLPFCLLDQKVNGVSTLTKQDLIDNGLSSETADSFITQNMALTISLAQKNEMLRVAASDTKESLSTQIRTVLPQATPDFVDFYTSQILTQ